MPFACKDCPFAMGEAELSGVVDWDEVDFTSEDLDVSSKVNQGFIFSNCIQIDWDRSSEEAVASHKSCMVFLAICSCKPRTRVVLSLMKSSGVGTRCTGKDVVLFDNLDLMARL